MLCVMGMPCPCRKKGLFWQGMGEGVLRGRGMLTLLICENIHAATYSAVLVQSLVVSAPWNGENSTSSLAAVVSSTPSWSRDGLKAEER